MTYDQQVHRSVRALQQCRADDRQSELYKRRKDLTFREIIFS